MVYHGYNAVNEVDENINTSLKHQLIKGPIAKKFVE